ncbi:MAG: MerR family transcriptional regulator [Firmicutes bacterium]|nr:MerR family transcriptional regulator [Bacillota bacterium]
MKAQDDRFTIRQVAEATGLSLHTLRYYERIGLIHPIGRAENTHRRYSAGDIAWIEFLTRLRATGMSIRQMLAYAELQRRGEETLPARLAMLQAHRRKVEAYMDELREHLRLICRKIEFYQARLPGNRVNHDADGAHIHESLEE